MNTYQAEFAPRLKQKLNGKKKQIMISLNIKIHKKSKIKSFNSILYHKLTLYCLI